MCTCTRQYTYACVIHLYAPIIDLYVHIKGHTGANSLSLNNIEKNSFCTIFKLLDPQPYLN